MRYVRPMPALTRAERIHACLTAAFAPVVLDVADESALHAGHAGARAGGETHYRVLMVAASLGSLGRVARSRAVHDALAPEFASGLHALSLTLRSLDEHRGPAETNP